MATIYRITQTAAPQRQPAGTANGGSAEIILFPGVRYERWEDDTPPAPSKGHGTASRGRPRKTG